MTRTEQVAAAVEAARIKAGLSKAKLARRADMTGKTLDRRLAGEAPGFNVEELDRIAAVTGVPIESFLGVDAA